MSLNQCVCAPAALLYPPTTLPATQAATVNWATHQNELATSLPTLSRGDVEQMLVDTATEEVYILRSKKTEVWLIPMSYPRMRLCMLLCHLPAGAFFTLAHCVPHSPASLPASLAL